MVNIFKDCSQHRTRNVHCLVDSLNRMEIRHSLIKTMLRLYIIPNAHNKIVRHLSRFLHSPLTTHSVSVQTSKHVLVISSSPSSGSFLPSLCSPLPLASADLPEEPAVAPDSCVAFSFSMLSSLLAGLVAVAEDDCSDL